LLRYREWQVLYQSSAMSLRVKPRFLVMFQPKIGEIENNGWRQ